MIGLSSPFLERFRLYVLCASDTSPNFTSFMGVQLLGHALTYNSVNLIQPGEVRHNSYVLLLGESSTTRKSTNLKLARACYNNIFSMPQQTSPESFIEILHSNPHRIHWMGEFTQILKQITANSYNAPMVEILNDLYDCPDSYHRKLTKKKDKEDDLRVDKPYLCVNSSCTPAMLKQYLTEEMVYGGFLVRWLLVEGVPSEHPRPRGRLETRFRNTKRDLTDDLKFLYEKSLEGNVFEFTDEALQLFNRLCTQMEQMADNMSAFAGRYTDYLVRIADILFISDLLTPHSDLDYKQDLDSAESTHPHLWNIAELIWSRIDNDSALTELTDYTALTDYIKLSSENYQGQNAKKYLYDFYSDPIKRRQFRDTHNAENHFLVSSGYVQRAFDMLLPVLETACRMATYVSLDKPVAKLREFLERNAPISRSEAMVGTHLNSKDMGLATDTLTQMEYMFPLILRIKREKTNVQKTIYCLTTYRNTKRCVNCPYRSICWNETQEEQAEITIGGITK